MISLLDSAVVVNEEIDAAIDATDHAYRMGKEDATEGRRQDAFIFAGSAQETAAYHEGYKDGAIMAAILTGRPARYWDPANPTEIQLVSWASKPTNQPTNPTAGQFKCPTCGTYYDPTYGGCPGCAAAMGRRDGAYVPFQQEPSAYADIVAAEYREDYIGW